jgi:fumarate reductase iron-sulfur subunit
MRNFPGSAIVVDISDFMANCRASSRGSSVRRLSIEDGEYLQTPAELDEFKQFSMCINCMLCYAACPVYALDPDFLGPAAIALGQRYNLDSRDEGAADRRDVLAAAEGAWACTLVGECSTACPKGVDPAGAIQRYKLTAATRSVKELLFPRGAR